MARATDETLDRTDPPAAGAAEAGGLYERDFAEWAIGQAELIRAGRLVDLDMENLAEEIESLGKEQYARIHSSIRVILLHMLTWDHQPERRTRSWVQSIRNQRDIIEDQIEMSPSLRRRRQEAVAGAYRRARLRAADETGLRLSSFPAECPYPLDEILDRRFHWPPE